MRRWIPLAVIVTGLSMLYPVQRWIDTTAQREVISDEVLYFSSSETIKKLSLGLHGIVADIYWIRTVQYFGNKLQSVGRQRWGDTRSIRMDLLAPLLKIVVELDPGHIPAYRFGAIFLPERDLPAAVQLLEAGISENPGEWRLYQDLGYVHWQSGEYAKAAQCYELGGAVKGAAWWMRDLAVVMKIKGGDREVARRIYSQYLESDDQNIREQAKMRLLQLRMLDELDVLNELLVRFKQETGTCPRSLRVLGASLHSRGLMLNQDSVPVDPLNFPYVLDPGSCLAKQAPESDVPRT